MVVLKVTLGKIDDKIPDLRNALDSGVISLHCILGLLKTFFFIL